MFNKGKIRYLFVGGFNTAAGYTIGVAIYKNFGSNLGVVWVGVICNALSITVSFLTYKTLVFRTKGMWLSEYMKSYVVYGGISLIGIFFLWLFVDQMKMSIWIAQALVMGITVLMSYIGHSRFTFNRRNIL